jgi:hypothetical protein
VPGMNRYRLHPNFAQVFRHACNLGSAPVPCQIFRCRRLELPSLTRAAGILPADDCGQRHAGSISAESGWKPTYTSTGFDLTSALSKRKYQTSMRCFRRLQTYEFRLGHLRRRRF